MQADSERAVAVCGIYVCRGIRGIHFPQEVPNPFEGPEAELRKLQSLRSRMSFVDGEAVLYQCIAASPEGTSKNEVEEFVVGTFALLSAF